MNSVADVFENRSGVVDSFDETAGLGSIRDAKDGREWPFHCTRIADGSRSMDPQTEVTYVVRPGPAGLEAVEVRPAT